MGSGVGAESETTAAADEAPRLLPGGASRMDSHAEAPVWVGAPNAALEPVEVIVEAEVIKQDIVCFLVKVDGMVWFKTSFGGVGPFSSEHG